MENRASRHVGVNDRLSQKIERNNRRSYKTISWCALSAEERKRKQQPTSQAVSHAAVMYLTARDVRFPYKSARHRLAQLI